jgi:hypothetical protein
VLEFAFLPRRLKNGRWTWLREVEMSVTEWRFFVPPILGGPYVLTSFSFGTSDIAQHENN